MEKREQHQGLTSVRIIELTSVIVMFHFNERETDRCFHTQSLVSQSVNFDGCKCSEHWTFNLQYACKVNFLFVLLYVIKYVYYIIYCMFTLQ